MELIIRLHHHFLKNGQPYQIDFIPDPVCWTEAPESLKMLWRQRNRWQRGLGQALYQHRAMHLNPRFGRIGLCASPYFLFVEFLSPILEVFGYLVFLMAAVLGSVQWDACAAFFVLSVFMGINLSLLAVLLEEFTLHRYPDVKDFLRLLVASVLENFGYRQFVNLARFQGMFHLLRKQNLWGHLERKGLGAYAPGS